MVPPAPICMDFATTENIKRIGRCIAAGCGAWRGRTQGSKSYAAPPDVDELLSLPRKRGAEWWPAHPQRHLGRSTSEGTSRRPVIDMCQIHADLFRMLSIGPAPKRGAEIGVRIDRSQRH